MSIEFEKKREKDTQSNSRWLCLSVDKYILDRTLTINHNIDK